MKVTPLAAGPITAAGDTISIELVEALETPPVVLLRWPAQPSVAEFTRFGATATAVMRIMAAAVAKLAEIRAGQL